MRNKNEYDHDGINFFLMQLNLAQIYTRYDLPNESTNIFQSIIHLANSIAV